MKCCEGSIGVRNGGGVKWHAPNKRWGLRGDYSSHGMSAAHVGRSDQRNEVP